MDDARRDWNDYALGPIYYALKPVYPRLPGAPPCLRTAAVSCMATGEMLAGNGGSGYALSPRMFDAIDLRQTGGKPRVVLDAEDYEGLLARIREQEAEGALLNPGAVS